MPVIESLSSVLWPICLLIIVLLFREEIRAILCRLSRQDERNTEHKQIPKGKKEGMTVTKPQPQPLQPSIPNIVPVRSNKSTGANFIELADYGDRVKLITPEGDIKQLEKKLFTERSFVDATFLENSQLEKYYKYIVDEKDDDMDVSKPDRPYIESYKEMLTNPNTEPSRMWEYIKMRKQVRWIEVKNHLNKNYGYIVNSGSMGASLKALEVMKYIMIKGQGDHKIITTTHVSTPHDFSPISKLPTSNAGVGRIM